MELEDVVLLLGILKPPPLSFPLHLSLSLPEEEEAALKRETTKETDGEMTKHSPALQTIHMQGAVTENTKEEQNVLHLSRKSLTW